MELARLNKKGFTLIEFLVAVIILSVGLLGLFQTVNVAINNNMTTQLRDEAVRLADERMLTEKSRVFEAISTNTRNENVSVNVSNAFKNYSVVKTTSEMTKNTKNIQINVSWRYKGQRYGHTMSSLVSETLY
jgi:type IV pilus assembly protein PilV